MTGADCDGGQTIQETIQDARSGLAEALPGSGPKARRSALVRVAPCRREAAQDAHGSDSGEHRKVVAVHLIFQSSLPDLVEAVKIERNPAAIRENQPVEAHGQPGLILVRHGLRRANNPRPSRDQDALPIRRVERNGNHGQDRAGEVTGKLRHERRFEERAFIDALPTGGVFRLPDARRGRIIAARVGVARLAAGIIFAASAAPGVPLSASINA